MNKTVSPGPDSPKNLTNRAGESSVTVSVSRKVNLGNYESEDIFVSISGVTPDMTDEQICELLDAGENAYQFVKAAVEAKVKKIKHPKPTSTTDSSYGPPPSDLYAKTATRIMAGWDGNQKREFKSTCENLGKDPVTVLICAHEDTCKSYDEFVHYAVTGQKPAAAKQRVTV